MQENIKIDYLDINKIKPYKRNAKKHPQEQIDQIVKSIEQFGNCDPIAVWGEKNTIVEGHGRYLALKQLGVTGEIPVIHLDHLSDDERRAYGLVHNKLTMNSGFDFDLLEQELNDIDPTMFDMSDFGFFQEEAPEVEEEESREVEEDDFDPDAEAEARCKRGQVWQLGNHRLMCGDSTSAEDVTRLMNGEKADMVFTDPPWNVNYGAQQNPSWKPRQIMNDSMSTDDFKNFMFSAFKTMNNASKAGSMTYVVMSAQEWGNMMLALADNGYHWSSTIIWNKDQLVLSRKDYHTKYEPIWYGWKEGASRLCPLEDRKQCDVWDFDRPKRSDEHPTMKPVPLVARAITNSSKKGNVVLDLFGGSGTTLIACEQLNRKCYMCELDPKYVSVILQRYINFKGSDEDVFLLKDGKKIPYSEVE